MTGFFSSLQPPLDIGFDAKDKNYNLIDFRGVPQVSCPKIMLGSLPLENIS